MIAVSDDQGIALGKTQFTRSGRNFSKQTVDPLDQSVGLRFAVDQAQLSIGAGTQFNIMVHNSKAPGFAGFVLHYSR